MSYLSGPAVPELPFSRWRLGWPPKTRSPAGLALVTLTGAAQRERALPPITKSQIARALRNGDITRQDLQEVLDGWKPKKRGRRDNLKRQAIILGVLEVLKAEGICPSKAKEILMVNIGLTNRSSFDRYLERAARNWRLSLLRELPGDNGEKIYGASMSCMSPLRPCDSYAFLVIPNELETCPKK